MLWISTWLSRNSAEANCSWSAAQFRWFDACKVAQPASCSSSAANSAQQEAAAALMARRLDSVRDGAGADGICGFMRGELAPGRTPSDASDTRDGKPRQ